MSDRHMASVLSCISDLVRWFGDVPLVLTDTKSLDGLEVTRTPQKEVFRQIIEDFEYCISHTMDKGDTSKGYQYGRLTKDACHGFLAKVYLWLGSVAQRDGKEILGKAPTISRSHLNIQVLLFRADVTNWWTIIRMYSMPRPGTRHRMKFCGVFRD